MYVYCSIKRFIDQLGNWFCRNYGAVKILSLYQILDPMRFTTAPTAPAPTTPPAPTVIVVIYIIKNDMHFYANVCTTNKIITQPVKVYKTFFIIQIHDNEYSLHLVYIFTEYYMYQPRVHVS